MIRNIIFDLGNVLVNVEYERFRNRLLEHNVTKETYDNFFLNGNYRLLGYEAGAITTDEFIKKCLNGLNLKMSVNEFARAFNNMFSEIRPMSEIVRQLVSEGNYNLFLLSNTSPLHFEHAKENFGYINLFHKFGLSYELKSLKPEKEIYERAVKYFNVKPDESLFIDDLKENCEQAERFGIKTINYDKTNHNGFVEQFNKFIKLETLNL
ncbi:MAG: HAD family phosphatase [Chlorobi bacterium]|nr:HAD family phosphatase [Chlorobiota bacterium]MCI0717263.1 HAD family phosphatase [Chlorobiota bacterium]